jgi:hypothetical protein
MFMELMIHFGITRSQSLDQASSLARGHLYPLSIYYGRSFERAGKGSD